MPKKKTTKPKPKKDKKETEQKVTIKKGETLKLTFEIEAPKD